MEKHKKRQIADKLEKVLKQRPWNGGTGTHTAVRCLTLTHTHAHALDGIWVGNRRGAWPSHGRGQSAPTPAIHPHPCSQEQSPNDGATRKQDSAGGLKGKQDEWECTDQQHMFYKHDVFTCTPCDSGIPPAFATTLSRSFCRDVKNIGSNKKTAGD